MHIIAITKENSMDLRNCLPLDGNQLRRIEWLEQEYRKFYTDPENATPRIIVNIPVERPKVIDRMKDPELMLKSQLDSLRPHLEMEDDRIPTIRVNLGTAQVASAFGAEIHYFEDSLPAAKTHPLHDIRDAASLEIPERTAGLYEQVEAYTAFFLENKPPQVPIQHPDIQSAFNSAHLIRGDDIFIDLIDHPEDVSILLDKVTDFMLQQISWLRNMITDDPEWFYDWGVLWKGKARISNCSSQMIGPGMYGEFVLPRDIRLMESIGGGRMHYCGDNTEVIKAFFANEHIHSLDYDSRHDLWELAALAPKDFALFQRIPQDSPTEQRLLNGDWPEKRNIILVVNAEDIDKGRNLLQSYRNACPFAT
jgi:hypothetical protein